MKNLVLWLCLVFSSSLVQADAYEIINNARQYRENLVHLPGKLLFYGKNLWSPSMARGELKGFYSGAYFVSILLQESEVLKDTYVTIEELDDQLIAWATAQEKLQLYPGCVVFWIPTRSGRSGISNKRVAILYDSMESDHPRVLQISQGIGEPALGPFQMKGWKFSHGRCFE